MKTQKTRLEEVEKIMPEKKTEVKSFYSDEFADQAELDQAEEKWIKDLPEGVEGVVIEHNLGFKKEIRK